MIPRVSLRLCSAVSRVTSNLQLYVKPKQRLKLQLRVVTSWRAAGWKQSTSPFSRDEDSDC